MVIILFVLSHLTSQTFINNNNINSNNNNNNAKRYQFIHNDNILFCNSFILYIVTYLVLFCFSLSVNNFVSSLFTFSAVVRLNFRKRREWTFLSWFFCLSLSFYMLFYNVLLLSFFFFCSSANKCFF